MNNTSSPVAAFVAAVQRRINRHLFWNALLVSATVGAGLALTIGLVYVVQGYAVPSWWFALTGGASLATAFAIWGCRRRDADRAAQFADNFFDLKDSVTSCQHFTHSGMQGGFYHLQSQQTNRMVADLQPEQIRYRAPRWMLAGLVVMGVLAIVLGLKAPSEAMQQRIAEQDHTLQQTQLNNQRLKELIDELEKGAEDGDEEKLLEANKLRTWVDQLEETTDRKEALRQYARLENQLNKASARLEQKRDEQILQKAAKELDKDRDTKELAKRLKQKKYEAAAKQLKRLRPKDKKLDQQRKDLARMKSASLRMATAAKSDRKRLARNQTSESSRKLQRHQEGDENSDELQQPSDLEDAIEELDDAVSEWEKALSEADQMELEKGECDEQTLGECESCRLKVDDKLSKIGDQLKRLGIKKRVRKKLASLCRACSQCQSGVCKSSGKGGKKPGWGSSDDQRDQRDDWDDNGQYTQLKGIKGKGPSMTKVEAAEDGSGVSGRRTTSHNRSFQRQVESFIQREDVPDDVKSGVKEYFKNIHQIDKHARQVGPTRKQDPTE
ncbi:MAG: hypothetical protein N2C12_08015 [Planctomycetales bacterium]